ncbi:hypothetical protein EBZ35_03060 [bacterium]|nr:hypothetical protein [bacterium]
MTFQAIISTPLQTQYSGCVPCARVENPTQTMVTHLTRMDRLAPKSLTLTPDQLAGLTKKLEVANITYPLDETKQIAVLMGVAKANARRLGLRYDQPTPPPTSLVILSTNQAITQHLAVASNTMMGIWLGTNTIREAPSLPPIPAPPYAPYHEPTAPYIPRSDSTAGMSTDDVTAQLNRQTAQTQAETRKKALENFHKQHQIVELEKTIKANQAATASKNSQDAIAQEQQEREAKLLAHVARGPVGRTR